jgi:hypothetical protein
VTRTGLANYREIMAALHDMDERLPVLRKNRAELKSDAPPIDEQIEEMSRDHRRRLLEVGAAGQLEIDSQVQLQVLPLDYAELLEQAKPVGKVEVDPAKLEARHDGQVKGELPRGPCSFIILGGEHDLSESVRRLGNGTVEYVRATTRRYKAVAADE